MHEVAHIDNGIQVIVFTGITPIDAHIPRPYPLLPSIYINIYKQQHPVFSAPAGPFTQPGKAHNSHRHHTRHVHACVSDLEHQRCWPTDGKAFVPMKPLIFFQPVTNTFIHVFSFSWITPTSKQVFQCPLYYLSVTRLMTHIKNKTGHSLFDLFEIDQTCITHPGEKPVDNPFIDSGQLTKNARMKILSRIDEQAAKWLSNSRNEALRWWFNW